MAGTVVTHGGPRAWPTAVWMLRTSRFAARAVVTKVCRRLCGVMVFAMPATLVSLLTIREASWRSRRRPSLSTSSGPRAGFPSTARLSICVRMAPWVRERERCGDSCRPQRSGRRLNCAVTAGRGLRNGPTVLSPTCRAPRRVRGRRPRVRRDRRARRYGAIRVSSI